MTSTVIVGGKLHSSYLISAVEYFGPLNITIPPLSVPMIENTAVYINGALYSCGGRTIDAYDNHCYKYDLATHSGTWNTFTIIPGNLFSGNPAVSFNDFFWYFNEEIQQVPVNGGNVTSYNWGLGKQGCAVGNGSHAVMIGRKNSTVLMNSDPSFPTRWTTVVELDTAVQNCGCLWFGNTIVVTGGANANGQAIATTQLINMDTFVMTLGAPLPGAIHYHRMGVIDGKPSVFGGIIPGFGISSLIYVYDSGTNTWSLSVRSLPGGLAFFGLATF